ncbi:uncharacterized protein PITG_13492 [Phytophthora infestans T30-4]|uniref:Uncharacterized protein n=1 Tax=Phytophthora infestans (strain T30-4) TaxID=403677 RepID=D0NM45_PHYIT|nr:uncharacterized protein PITG_13492 [Phytophthora infestans T30-4]EEY60766.1 conserved hypothetical protein [Phytophthora infestans T30-4]|eukprot:XP_002899712.1 conserved hypothetical protein [Phytophthora infestans T30-4]
MRSWFFLTALVAVASTSWLSQVEAAACAEICYTTELKGFGPGGSAGCSCSGLQQGARTGSGSCSCGQCYTASGSGVIGYAVNSDGTCTFGTNCGDCDYSSTSSGSTTPTMSSTASSGSSTTSTTPPSSTPTATTGASSNSSSGSSSSSSSTSDNSGSSTITSVSSSSGSTNNNAGEAGSSADTSSNGLKTWQIALIICCGVLVFTVAVVSVLSCYCKARNRLYENEDDQADASYYQQQYPRLRDDVFGSSAAATPSLFSQNPQTSSRRSGSSGSLSSELKAMYANSANSGSSDRLGVGLAPVHMRNSSGDLAGMAGSYPNERILSGSYLNERILSGSYPTDRRPSAGNRSQGRRPSVEQGYSTARDRDSLAVEL